MITQKSIFQILLSLIIFGFSLTHAQDQATEQNSLKPGAWALEFGISSLITLTSFQGTTISVQYQTSTTNAWRAGITINGTTQTGTGLQLPIPADTLTNTNSSNNSNSLENVLLKVQYLWYTNPENIIHFYTGIGPIIGYNHSLNDQQSIYRNGSVGNNTVNDQITNTSTNTWSAGASGVVGVEYFPARVFSLHAEYGNNLTYQQQKTETTTRSTNYYATTYATGYDFSGTTHGWTFNNGSVYFGLSVYF